MKNSLKKITALTILLIVLIFSTGNLLARAGGAGGSSSSSSSSSSWSSSSSSSYSGGSSSGSGEMSMEGIIGMLIFIVVFFIIARVNQKKRIRKNSIKVKEINNLQNYDEFIASNPDFSEEIFLQKVNSAFKQIQEAWSKKDMNEVRRFVSDGIYQKFITQFAMMDLLQQENTISDVRIISSFITDIKIEGDIDILHVAITASINDHFVSKMHPNFNSGGIETFTEIWSFIHKRGSVEKDIFTTQNCPACNSVFEKGMTDVAKCEYCGAMINSGEYDWVLSEITQQADFGKKPYPAPSMNLGKACMNAVISLSNFSVQNVEDKAGNAYMQYQTALALGNPIIVKRFISDEFYTLIEKAISDYPYIFNRLYTNYVTMIDLFENEDFYRAAISVKASYQRVEKGSHKLKDKNIVSGISILIMDKSKNEESSKGSLYTHTCPACGAQIQDSADISCPYCQTPFNSSSREWIVSEILSAEEYIRKYRS